MGVEGTDLGSSNRDLEENPLELSAGPPQCWFDGMWCGSGVDGTDRDRLLYGMEDLLNISSCWSRMSAMDGSWSSSLMAGRTTLDDEEDGGSFSMSRMLFGSEKSSHSDGTGVCEMEVKLEWLYPS
uniref:(northern house mosquito) hypothetical protein n=1 Tax=Culex pipiens TaxID=7175 RepID=A0A8D8HVC2_CULPI